MNTQELRKLAEEAIRTQSLEIQYDDYIAARDAYHSKVSPQAILELLDKIDQLQADASRMDWIQRHLFGHKWNGVVGPGGQTRWDVMTGYRHITAKMTGDTFRDAIDAAMKEQP